MSKLLEFRNLCLSIMISEASVEMASRDQKYRNFLRAMHRGGFLLDRQEIASVNKGEPAWTALKKQGGRWSGNTHYMIIWGDKDAVLVNIAGGNYNLYVYDNDTDKITEYPHPLSSVKELKTDMANRIGKTLGYSDFTPAKKLQSISATTPRQKARVAALQQKWQGDTKEFKHPVAAINKKIQPLFIRMLNRSLGNLLDHITGIMKHPPENTYEITKIKTLLDRAMFLKNQILFLQGHEIAENQTLKAALSHAMILAAMEKYPDLEVGTHGNPTRLHATDYSGADSFSASGAAIRKFYSDLQDANYKDLTLILRWMARLL